MCLVDIPTGRVSLVETDFNLGGIGSPTQTRTYRSTNLWSGDLGYGWGHSFGMQLYLNKETQSLIFRDVDGRRINFEMPTLDRMAENAVEELTIRLLPHDRLVWPSLARDAHRDVYAVTNRSGWGLFFDSSLINNLFPLRGVADASGNFIYVTPAPGGLPSRIEFPAGRTLHLVRDGSGRLTEIWLATPRKNAGKPGDAVPASSRLIAYEYSSAGDLSAVVDSAGRRIYDYDRMHRLLAHQNRVGADCRTEYDATGRCRRMFLPGKLEPREYQYDLEHRITTVKDPNGAISRYTYSEDERVTEAVDKAGYVSSFLYDSSSRLIQSCDQGGGETTIMYDSNGRQVGKSGPGGEVTGIKRDDRGRIIQFVPPSGQVKSFLRDSKGRVIEAKMDDRGTCKVSYDGQGQLAGAITPFGQKVSLQWSRDGRVLTETDGVGIRTRQTFDEFGHLVAAEDSVGAVTKYLHDNAGRVVRIINPDQTLRQFFYDAENHLIAFHDEADHVTRWAYDLVGRRIMTTTPTGQVIKFEYDQEDRLVGIEEPGGLRHRLRYDERGLLAEQRFSDGRIERYEHSPRGLPIKLMDAAGGAMTATRDLDGRIIEVHYPDGTAKSIKYEDGGRAARVEHAGDVLEQEWGAAAQPVLERFEGEELSRAFGPAGELLVLSDESGRNVSYNYDVEGRIVEVLVALPGDSADTTDVDEDAVDPPTPMPRVHHFQHDRRGLMTRWEMPRGKVETRSYDQRGRMLEQSVQLEGSVLVRRQYRYDATGRLSTCIDSRRGQRDFTYDPDGRLTSRRSTASTEKILWNNSGDLISGGLRYAAGHRAMTAGALQFEYDARGFALRRRTGGSTVDEISYTSQGLIRSVLRGDGKRASYRYDPLGRLCLRDDGATKTRYRWDGEMPWLIQEQAQETMFVHLPQSHSPIEQITNGQGYSVHVDHQGVVQELIDDHGIIAWERSDDAWGAGARGDERSAALCSLGFPGQLWDRFSGLFYNRYRFYCCESAHYVTPDPIGLWGGLDAYRYVPDPVNNIDPDGLSCRGKNDDSTLYRGDKRTPDVICKEGFAPQNPAAGLSVYQHVEGVPPGGSNWVSTTYDGDEAQKFTDDHTYVIANPGCGVEVDCDPDVFAKYGNDPNSEKEIAFNKAISPSNVVGFWTKAGGPSSFQLCP